LDFKSKAKINSISVLVSGIIGVLFAISGHGVWSLVFQPLSKTVISLFALTIVKRWKPLFVFSKESFVELFKFGNKLLVAGTIATIVNNFYTIIIGKYFSAKDLGYYSKSLQFANLLSGTVSEIVQNVSFPVLSSVQDENERLYQIYRRLIKFTMFVVLPLMVGFSFIAEPFVRLTLTDKWLPAVPLIQWLCVARVFTPLSALNMNILNVKGRSDLFLFIDLIKLPLTIVALIITYKHGILALVIGQSITIFLSYIINTYYSEKLIGYGLLKQIKDMFPRILATMIMSCVLIIFIFFNLNDFVRIILSITVGLITYLGVSYLFKLDEVIDLYSFARSFFKKKN
jgi:O-antigen/teichoic acid export membrane protein